MVFSLDCILIRFENMRHDVVFLGHHLTSLNSVTAIIADATLQSFEST